MPPRRAPPSTEARDASSCCKLLLRLEKLLAANTWSELRQDVVVLPPPSPTESRSVPLPAAGSGRWSGASTLVDSLCRRLAWNQDFVLSVSLGGNASEDIANWLGAARAALPWPFGGCSGLDSAA